MPGRVREFNAVQAAGIAAALGMNVPPGWGWPANVNGNVSAAPAGGNVMPGTTLPLAGIQVTCPRCQQTNIAGSRFCAGCGAPLQ